MDKVTKLLHSINSVIKSLDDDPTKDMADFEGKDLIKGWVDDLESKIAKLQRKQLKYFKDGINGYTAKDFEMDMTLLSLLSFVENTLFVEDSFEEDLTTELTAFFNLTISELATLIMETIDKEVAFEVFSTRTTNWINNWSSDLASLMNLGSHNAIKSALTEALDEGEGIPKIVERLNALPEFNRNRARVTAITEILTANSVSQYEAYKQSPAVTGKTWKHSGSKGIDPRQHHIDLGGTTIGLDEYFQVGDSEALYPRDVSLPAKERVLCHCVLGPSVDRDIIGLSLEEKERIRQEVLANMD